MTCRLKRGLDSTCLRDVRFLIGCFATGGWPYVALTGILCDSRGIGDMRLLIPALSHLCERATRWLA